MKRVLFSLLLLLPIIGCNQPSPLPPGPGPAPPGGGGTGSGGGTTVNNDPTRNWYTYTASDGNYAIKYPGKPDEQKQADPVSGRIEFIRASYSTNGGKRKYSSAVQISSAPGNGFTIEKGLDGARKDAAEKPYTTITFERKIDSDGASGRELSITSAYGTKAKQRMFLVMKGVDLVFYQCVVIDMDGNIDTPDTDLFLNSLQMNTPGRAAPVTTTPPVTPASFEGVWSGTPQPGKDYVKVVKITKGTFPCEGEYETEWAGGGGFQAPVTWNLEGENLVGSQHNGTNTIARVTLYHGTLYGKIFTLMPPGQPGKQLSFEAFSRQSDGKP